MITSQKLLLPHSWRGLVGKISPNIVLKTIPCTQDKTLNRFYSCYKYNSTIKSVPLAGVSGSCTLSQGFVPRSLLVNRQLWLAGVTQDRGYRSGRSRQDTSHEDETPQPQNISPQLMDFPWVIWPSLWHTIRNWIFANLIIRPYLDREFSLSTFKAGAIQALVHVSQELAKGNFSALEGLIISSSMEEVKRNFAKLSLKQRLDLGVVAEDIFFSFPYQIGVIFTNEGGPHERIFVEITMCYHVFKGFQDHLEQAARNENTGSIRGVYDNHDRISIANYRFIREFTRGVEDEWTVNVANHFKPGEYIQQR